MSDDPTAEAGSTTNDGATADGAPTEPVAEKTEDGKTFTQAEMDKIIAARVQREAGKYADYDQLKSSHAELEKIKAANATDLEKAVAAAKAEGISEVTARVNSRLVKSEARAIAAGAHFHNPADAVGLVDLSGIKVSDDGDVDADAIKALITDLAKERPYLIKTAEESKPKPKADPSQGARGGGPATTAQQFAAALGPILSP